MPAVLCYNTRRDSGKKVMSGKLQKELTEMNRETTTLYVLVVLAMVTLALPAPSYPSNAPSGFAEVPVCLKSRFPAAKTFYDLRLDLSSFDKMVVNSIACTKHAKSFSRVEYVERGR